MNRSRAVNVGLVIMVVMVLGVGAASIPVTGDLPLQTNTGFTVTLDQPGTFTGLSAFTGQDTITITSGTVSAAGAGQLEITDSDLSGNTRLVNMDVTNTTALVDPSDKAQFDVTGDVNFLEVRSGLSTGDSTVDFQYSATGNFDLTLRNLGASQDFAVVDSGGTPLGGGTSDANGTATFTMTQTGTNSAIIITNEAPSLSGFDPSGETITTPTPTLSVDVDDSSFPKLGSDEITVEFFNTTDNSSFGTDTLTSAGTATTAITLTSNGQKSYFVTATDQYGASTTSNTQTFALQEPAPVIENITPADGQRITSGPVTITANVSDSSLPGGDTVTVEFSNATSTFSTQNLSSNGTVSATVPGIVGGTNVYTLNVSDTFGNQITSGTRSFKVPAELTLRNVNDASDILDDANVDATVRFFEEEGDRVFPRNPTNGVIDMSGLPVNEPFVVGIRDANDTYISRLTLIDTIFEQQSVYLINSSVDTAIIRFTIEDRTGQFSGEGTKLQVRRAINTTTSPADEEEYVIVAGDIVGSQLQFEAELEQDVRYRVRIQNGEGETRQLGAFTARVDQVISLTISGIDVGVDIPEDEPVIETSLDESNPNTTIAQFSFVDLAEETTSLQLKVLQAGNTSNVLDTAEISGPPNIKTFQHTTTLTGDDSELKLLYDVEYVRNGQRFEVRKAYGLNQYPIGLPLSGPWKSIFSVGFLIVLGGVFSVRNARIGAIIIPGVAALLYSIGFLTGVATILGIALAMVLAIGYNLAFAGRGAIR